MEKKRGIETFFKFPKDKLAGKKSPEQDDSDQSESDSDEDNPFEEMEQDLAKECDPKNEAAAEKNTVDSEKPVEEQSGPKQVWILGSSFLSRAKLFAESKPHWCNLGLNKQNVAVHWFGSTGMRLETFGQEVEKAKEAYGIPDIVIVHLGGNDMGRIPYKLFFKAVKYDFRRFGILFRKTHLIYSTILPRTEWLMTPVEQVRVKFNNCIVKCAWSLGFHVLTHNDIEGKVIARFKTGRSNDLSDVEYHQLLVGIRDSVKTVLNM